MRATGGLAAAAALTALGVLAPPVALAAEQAAPRTFSTTGESVFVVPAGVTSVNVSLVGAPGGPSRPAASPAQGGRGGEVQGTLAVFGGEALFVEVGGPGAQASVYGAPGGGNGGGEGAYGGGIEGSGNAEGGGGGGATDVRTCPVDPAAPGRPAACASMSTLASRLLVAGGGGGAGGESSVHVLGGAGGAAGSVGNPGPAYGSPTFGGLGGAPGERLAGGLAGGNSLYYETAFNAYEDHPAQPGTLGAGGTGGGYNAGGGGGGGGGIYGGGGGGAGNYKIEGITPTFGGGGGGGGGASGAPAGAGGVSVTNVGTAPAAAQPSATFTWTLPPPAAVTGAPQAVTSTSATLTGTVNPDGSSVDDCHFTISPAPPAGGSIPCSQQVGAGGTPVAVSAGLAGLTPGSAYTVTLTAASAQGSDSGSPVTFGTPPSLNVTNLKLSIARFRRGRRAATIAKQVRTKPLPTATVVSFTLSQAASVRLSFEQAHAGMLVGHRCVAATKAHRHGRRCTRYTALARGVARGAHAGTDRIVFYGVLDGGARLAPGAYRLSLSAVAGGDRALAAQRPTFTLLG